MAMTSAADGGMRKGRIGSGGRPVMVPLESLHPTQVTVGMRAVKHMRLRLESLSMKAVRKSLARRPIPAVRGPGGALFIIDNHHFSLALWHAEVASACACIIDDKSNMAAAAFWRRMEIDGRLHPYDEDGRRVPVGELPVGLHELRHDPYRDLAWEVRKVGGFSKTRIPYAEFQWAAFFRDHIAASTVRRNPDAAFEKAMKLSQSRSAMLLPGYSGEHT
jgi:hypothetical protein